ncbi:lipase secretion chaperone [Noviherbaspirillum saxi]|nr:lipase secretion chaperone [Noviherbaspirillum saxi]
MKKSVVALGAAALFSLALFVTAWPGKNEDATPKLGAEPDMFSFVKPGIGPAPDASMQAAAAPAAPPSPQAVRSPTVTVEELVQTMRTQGASEDEIYRMRAAAWSPEAAARLAERDRAEATWDARVDAYRVERNRLINAGAIQTTLQQLRNARFSAEEQVQLAAYESSGVPRLISLPAD